MAASCWYLAAPIPNTSLHPNLNKRGLCNPETLYTWPCRPECNQKPTCSSVGESNLAGGSVCKVRSAAVSDSIPEPLLSVVCMETFVRIISCSIYLAYTIVGNPKRILDEYLTLFYRINYHQFLVPQQPYSQIYYYIHMYEHRWGRTRNYHPVITKGSIKDTITVFPPSSLDFRLFLFFTKAPCTLPLVVSGPPRIVFDGHVPDCVPRA
jgi:hypothetical protein